MKIKLSDLQKPAVSVAAKEVAKELPAPTRKGLVAMKREARVRLTAQEYVRNGMDFAAAWATVGGLAGKKSVNMGIYQILGKDVDLFADEVKRLVDASDIEKGAALSVLWAMFNTSILDFFDEHGDMLSVAELKKLPRVMQIMLTKLEVKTIDVVVKGPDGKVMVDDNGSPYLRTISKVKLEIPDKLASISQLAQIMRWVGPAVNINVEFNVGRQMADADERVKAIGQAYESSVVSDQ